MSEFTNSSWHLHDMVTQKSWNGISSEQVLSILQNSPTATLKNWVIWTAGWPNWKNITEVPSLISKLGTLAPAPSILQSNLQTEPAVKLESESPRAGGGNSLRERRRAPRYEARFRIVIVSGSVVFRTHTKDVSILGIHLEDPVPPGVLHSKCEIFIGSPELKENVSFHASVVGDPKNPCRFEFAEKKDAQAKLKAWIQTLVEKHGLKAS